MRCASMRVNAWARRRPRASAPGWFPACSAWAGWATPRPHLTGAGRDLALREGFEPSYPPALLVPDPARGRHLFSPGWDDMYLDTTDPAVPIAGIDVAWDGDLDRVLDGIAAAVDAGLHPVKLNVVVMRGVNDDEVVEFARFGRERGVEVRFIEFMPLDAGRGWTSDQVVSQAEIVEARSGEPAVRRLIAPMVVLAAGTLGSTEILLRSLERGLALSERLGQRFSANGDIIAFGYGGKAVVNAIGVGHPAKVPRWWLETGRYG